jgi:hypothetical protein
MLEPLGAATARAEIEHAPTVRAPLFYSLIQRMAAGQRWVVLDLGPARNETIALLGQFRCRLDIADLNQDLDRLDPALSLAQLQGLVEAALPRRHAESADLVLCWDLLNYLPRPLLDAVMSQVAARVKPGAYAHALIAYSDRTVAERPGQFFPVSAEQLCNPVRQGRERPAIRHAPADLTASAPGLTIERAVLMANGMQEYLFRF